MTTRVHLLAKELGVKSTAIVEKCQAEGLDVKNHMSTLSAGLEATIREWFSEGEHSTTVESAAPVDLDKVKMKVARKKKAQESAAIQEVEIEAAAETPAVPEASGAVVLEIPAGPEAEKAEELKIERPHRRSPQETARDESGRAARPEPAVEVTPEIIAPATPETPAGPAETEQEELQPAAEVPVVSEPPLPKKLAHPPKLAPPAPVPYVPAPAKLQGPRVVRMERAEPVSPSYSRSPRRNMPTRAGEAPPAAAPAPPKAGAGKRGRKDRGRGGPAEGEESSEAAKKKQRGRRRGRGPDTALVVTPTEWSDRDLLERQERLASASGTKLHSRERRMAEGEHVASAPAEPHRIEKAVVKEPVTVKDLSVALGVRASDIISKLLQLGVIANINQSLEIDTAVMIALEYGVELKVETKPLLLEELQKSFDEIAEEELAPRAPVVAFLGHVDHGKTSLLDYIRKAKVAAGEAGGITQHIGSYLYDDGQRRVTFLDTPGHKAFTAMRARGANMTDIVVLVVAADDGVMPQTEEAINHAKAAGVPIVVALNKIDLPNVDEHRVLGQLSDKGLIPAEWGGDTEVIRTDTATTGRGMDELVEMLDYQAELRALKSRTEGPATGWVIESEMDTGKGVVARLLVKAGTLRVSDVIVTGRSYGRIRSMSNALGKNLPEAGPSTPVEISGLDEVPAAGDRFFVMEEISEAKRIADEQRQKQREKALSQRRQVTLENLFSEIKTGEVKELNVIVKADVQGSVDVLRHSVVELNTPEVAVRILHSAVGGISESDVLLAEASNAIVIGFQVIADERARALAEQKGVQIRLYRIIYQITDDIRQALEGMLAPSVEEKQLGRVEVRDVFKISKLGSVAGCYVTDGIINRSAKFRLIRDNIIVRDDIALESLRRVKDDVSEVRNGFECGIKLAGFDDVKVGDQLQAYEMVKVSRTLDSVAK